MGLPSAPKRPHKPQAQPEAATNGADKTPIATGKDSSRSPTSSWRSPPADFGPPRVDVEEKKAARERMLAKKRRKAMRRGYVSLVVFGGIAFVFGWIAAYEWFGIPGVFLASQVGVPALLMLLLGRTGRVLRDGIADKEYANATAALPRSARWALVLFWFFITLTTVWQLAVSLALAILAFQLYATNDRLRRIGHTGFGPGLKLTVVPMVTYVGWLVAFELAGTVPLFDVLSFVGSFVFAFVMLSQAGKATMAVRLPEADAAALDAAPRAHGTRQKHLLVAVVVGYLFFRFFVSSNIPYGPIVEWFLVSLAALFFALIAAARIGTVPTTRSLPPPHVRSHEQRVWSLPDRHIWEVERNLSVYIHDNKEKQWMRNHYLGLMQASGIPDQESAAALSALEKKRMNKDDRRDLVLRLTRLLQEADGNGTDRLKTQPPLAGPGPPAPAA